MKYTDFGQVKQLATNILKDDKKMIQLTVDLGAKLKTLKATFQDDGIDEVETYVNGLTAKLNNSQEAFMTIANELIEYANILKMGKG